jgi:hypothetical protein
MAGTRTSKKAEELTYLAMDIEGQQTTLSNCNFLSTGAKEGQVYPIGSQISYSCPVGHQGPHSQHFVFFLTY